MNRYTIEEFGSWLQQVYTHKIATIRVGQEPVFFFADSLEELLLYFLEQYDRPMLKGFFDDESKTREGTLLLFNQDRMELCLIRSGNRRDHYRFFRPEIFQELKERLMDEALSWLTFVGMPR